jgi:hypothetical protein
MGRIRSLATQTPAITISVLAVALSLGSGAYAATQAGHSQPAANSQAAQAKAADRAPARHTTITSGVSWNSITLINGWASENANFSSGNPKVAIQSNIVYLSGSLHQPTPGNATFSVLPSQFRPTHNMWITVYTVDDSVGTLFIGKDGTMEAFSPGACGTGDTAQCYTSLATVSYPINS